MKKCKPGSPFETGSGCPVWLLSVSFQCSGCEGLLTTRWSYRWWTHSLDTWAGGKATFRKKATTKKHEEILEKKTVSQGHWLGFSFLKQRRVVCGQVNTLLVNMNTSCQMLVLLLHVRHVLFNGMEGCLCPHFVRPPHMDSEGTHKEDLLDMCWCVEIDLKRHCLIADAYVFSTYCNLTF